MLDIEVLNLTKRFGDFTAVDGAQLFGGPRGGVWAFGAQWGGEIDVDTDDDDAGAADVGDGEGERV